MGTGLTKIAAIVLLISLASASALPVVPSCNAITSQLYPCLSYLQGAEASPPQTCCNGVEYLTSYSNDGEARQAICGCIKGVADLVNIEFDLISGLPQCCGVCVDLPPFSRDIDCSQI